jgi:heat shock protein HslJ
MKTIVMFRAVTALAFVCMMNACQQVLYVAPRKVDCSEGINACHLVKRDLDDNWILQSGPIAGLEYVEGYQYRVKAKRVRSRGDDATSDFHLLVTEVLERTQVYENSVLLGNKGWILKAYGTAAAATTPLDDTNIHIVFNTDEGKVNGSAGCNRFFGKYEVAEEAMEISAIGTTKMACAPAVLQQETAFLELLQDVRKYSINENTLELSDQSGNILVFEMDRE